MIFAVSPCPLESANVVILVKLDFMWSGTPSEAIVVILFVVSSPGQKPCLAHFFLFGSRSRENGHGPTQSCHEKKSSPQTVPSRPKLLQKTLYKKLEAINFVIITKALCIQLEEARKIPQKYHKNNCFRELLCNNFGQDGSRQSPLNRSCLTRPAGRRVKLLDTIRV